ncbi:MAG: hypothetical protein NVSMB22_25120 [Chloroflexota bacterium]
MLAEKQTHRGAEPVPASRPAGRFVPSLYQVATFAVLAAIFIIGMAPRLDTDLWWHLKDGSYIATHHVVPSHDFMSYSFRGHSWTDHEWLAELVLYGLYRLGGLWGLISFFAVVICATFALVYLNLARRGINRVLALFVLAFAFVASTGSWGPRIQMMTLFFLAAYMLTLLRFEQTRDRRLLAIFPALMVLWTNIHGGFVLGLVVLTLTLLGESLNRRQKRDNAYTRDDLKMLLFALVASAAVTMINPNGVRQLLYPLTFVVPNAYTNLIQESASPNFHMPVMMVFEAMLLVLIGAFYAGRAPINWAHIFLVVAFTHLAFSQVRNVPLWCVVISPLLAVYLQNLLPASTRRRREMKGGIKTVLNLTLLALVLIVYTAEAVRFISVAELHQAELDNYPAGAVAYMGQHQLPRHVFVSYEWGGYLLWKLSPRYSDYMDSRADTLYGKRILQGYLDMYAAQPNWRSQLHTMGVQTVLVQPTAPLASVLAQDHTWRRAYHDRVAVVYYR